MVIAIDKVRFPYDATIAAIAEKKKVQRSYGNHSQAIAATTIAEIVVAAIAAEWRVVSCDLKCSFVRCRTYHKS